MKQRTQIPNRFHVRVERSSMFPSLVRILIPLLLTISLVFPRPNALGKTGTRGLAASSGTAATEASLKVEDFVRNLAPEEVHAETSEQIVRLLRGRHYRRLVLDNGLSSKLLDGYLSALDGNRIYFTAADIRQFERFRTNLDEALKDGNLKPAYAIFNRYHRRVAERLIFQIDRIDGNLHGLQADIEETLEIDRTNAPWPPDRTALRELWRKRLKNEIIKLKLKGKTPEEISKTLGKKYRTQLNRATQTKSEDAFRIYMNSLARIFDPHTQYFSPRMSENFKIQMSLSLEGIGAVLQTENEHTKVVRLVPAGPADKGKELMPGDRIVGVGQGTDGEMLDVVGWRLDDVVQLIRGPKETVVRLEILPAGMDDDYQTRTISIRRNTVKLEEQAARKEILDLRHNGRAYKIGVIEIPTFYMDFKAYHAGRKDYKSTTRDVRRMLKELAGEGVDGIVIDLRENGGGALQEATELTGLFIEKGPTVQVKKTDGSVSRLHDENPDIAYDGPLVVMVNRMSASAAEIFAGAIQDYRRGIIAGSRTFGKGTVQSLIDLDHGQLKLTFAKFYRVTGESTQHRGVIPDIGYPPIYDAEKIGESALPDALPWGRIRPARYLPWPDLNAVVADMKTLHESRVDASPDFAYLLASIKEMQEDQKLTRLPLNENTRKALIEQRKERRLAVENKRRLAKGLPLLKNIEEEEENDEEENNGGMGKPEKDDPLLIETGHILADLIVLSGKR